MFEIGRVYNRQRDIHEPYRGQERGGISTPSDQPFVLLFTGESGQQYGYSDGWDVNGIFLYTGEGQVGNMKFDRGNKAIRDHAANGKDLHLFESLGKGQGYRYLGTFACSTWEFRQGKDRKNDIRQTIVFHLIRPNDSEVVLPEKQGSTESLRQRALLAATQAEERSPREARRRYYERSAAVRHYVLARAGGVCEACDQSAPFRRPNGILYLEPHHTRRMSDGGPDHPRWVGAVCPNCHREMHYGVEGEEKNKRLQERLAVLENV